MKKRLFILLVILSAIQCLALERVVLIDKEGTRVNPGQLHTDRSGWRVVDETTSADNEATDLGVTERTYQAVKIAILAEAATPSDGDGEISILDIPNSWNAIHFRGLGITDGGTVTYQVYLGTLGDGNRDVDVTTAQITAGIAPFNCTLVNAGQLAFTIGTQESIYAQVAFTSGSIALVEGDIIAGNTGSATATVVSVGTLTSGTYAAGTAAGTIQLKNRNGTFESENLNLVNSIGTALQSNIATIGADIVHFELADTLTISNDTTWPKTWSETNPTGNLVAEGRIDHLNADIAVFVPTTASADSKLLAAGE